MTVNADDLEWAATWLLAYEDEQGRTAGDSEADPEDDRIAACRRVAAWLQAEADRRQQEILSRQVAREIAARTGRRPDDPKVVLAARKVLERAHREDGWAHGREVSAGD